MAAAQETPVSDAQIDASLVGAVTVESWECGSSTPEEQLAAAQQMMASGELGAAYVSAGKAKAKTVSRAQGALTAEVTAAAGTPSFYTCEVRGCFYWADDVRAAWSGTNEYGYKVKRSNGRYQYYRLGDIRWYFTDALNGREVFTYPQGAVSTRATTGWRWFDERLYLSAGCPSGCSLANRLYRSQATQRVKQAGQAVKYEPVSMTPLAVSTNTQAKQITSYATTVHIVYWKDLNPSLSHITWWTRTRNYKMAMHGTAPNVYYRYTTALPSAPVENGAL